MINTKQPLAAKQQNTGQAADKITKQELIKLIADRTQTSQKKVSETMQEIYKIVCEILSSGKELVLPNFLSVKLKYTAGRKGRNPQTGATVMISPKTRAVISPGKGIRTAANEKITGKAI